MRLLLISVTSSRAVFAGGLIAVAGVVIAVTSEPAGSVWVGRAQNTASYATVFGFAIAGCLSVLAGYLTGGELSRDEHSLLRRGSRSVTSAVLLRAAGDLVWLWSGLLIALAAAFVRTASFGGNFRTDSWSPVLLSACSVGATYASGMLVGAVLRHQAFLVLVAPLPYAATLLSSSVISLSERWKLQFLVGPFVDQSWYPASVPAPGAFLVLAGYVTGVASVFLLTAMGVLELRSRRRALSSGPPAAALIATTVTVVTAGMVVTIGGPSGFGRANPAGVVCTSGDAAVCLWGDHTDQLPVWQAAARDAALAVEGLPVGPRRYVQTLVPLSSPEDVEIQTQQLRPTVDELRDAMLETRARELLASCVPSPANVDAFSELMELLNQRVAGEGTRAETVASYDSIVDSCG